MSEREEVNLSAEVEWSAPHGASHYFECPECDSKHMEVIDEDYGGDDGWEQWQCNDCDTIIQVNVTIIRDSHCRIVTNS